VPPIAYKLRSLSDLPCLIIQVARTPTHGVLVLVSAVVYTRIVSVRVRIVRSLLLLLHLVAGWIWEYTTENKFAVRVVCIRPGVDAILTAELQSMKFTILCKLVFLLMPTLFKCAAPPKVPSCHSYGHCTVTRRCFVESITNDIQERKLAISSLSLPLWFNWISYGLGIYSVRVISTLVHDELGYVRKYCCIFYELLVLSCLHCYYNCNMTTIPHVPWIS